MGGNLTILKSSMENSLNKNKFKNSNVLFAILMFVIFFSIHSFFFQLSMFIKGIIVLIAGILLSFYFKKSETNINDEILKNKIGELSLNADKIVITIHDEIIQIDKNYKSEIKVYLNSFNGEVSGYAGYNEHHLGTNNILEINSNSKACKFYIYLENEEAYNRLQSMSSWCLDNKLNIKEYTKNERSYYGKKMSYAEIQQLK